MDTQTINITRKRLCLVIILCMIAGIPIGEYIGSTQQLASDENHIIQYADDGKFLNVRGHTYNISEINIGLNESVIINNGE